MKPMKCSDSVPVRGAFQDLVAFGNLLPPKNMTMNGEKYWSVLKDHLIPFKSFQHSTHFLQDGAPCHASKHIKNFLADKTFDLFDWLENSADLNPIVNC